jgi:hypothetical protein
MSCDQVASANGKELCFSDGSLGSEVYFMFAHLKQITDYEQLVVNETQISRGQTIGQVGETGNATGPHLHLECWSSLPAGYPLGQGYYSELPTDKYDPVEFIQINRCVGNSYEVICHAYNLTGNNTWLEKMTSGWQSVGGAQELQFVPLGYNNYFLTANTDQSEAVSYHFGLLVSGNYELSVFIPNRYFTSVQAHYVLRRSGQSDVNLYLNASNYVNQWVVLGSFSFSASVANQLILTSSTVESPAKKIAADAIKLRLLDDWGGATRLEENSAAPLVEDFRLFSYPNPFNSQVNFVFYLAAPQTVDLSIYNLLGHKVARVYSGQMTGGRQDVNWQATSLASGIYLAVCRVGDRVYTRKVNYVR